MAQPINCDICGTERAVQMLSNLETGEVMAMGPACMPVFYGQSVLAMMDAGDHKGLPQKCQACRRVHERMTLATAAAAPDHGTGLANVRDQAAPAAQAAGDDAPGWDPAGSMPPPKEVRAQDLVAGDGTS